MATWRRRFSRRGHTPDGDAVLERGARVYYRGESRPGLPQGSVGTIVSDVPGPMNVMPYATPPTVPEDDVELDVEIEFDGFGIRTVDVEFLVPDTSET